MAPLEALTYSFIFGLLHGVLPDEHTWPITFSYAIGGGSGKEGMKAGLYFSGAFTAQRMLVSELAYLALTPYLLSPAINGIVYIVVGLAMSAVGLIVLRRNLYPHLHLLRVRHIWGEEMGVLKELPIEAGGSIEAPPPRWAIIHGFLAGFGFGGFSLFINTVAVPAMPRAWWGFLPGLAFGLGTMITLAVIGTVFGAFLHWTSSLTPEEIKRIGAQTGGRTLLFGGLLFTLAGIVMLLRLDRHLPLDIGVLLIGLFMITIAIPAFFYSWREVLKTRKPKAPV